MQNHSGQHVLSQAFVVAASAQTVAWRLSESTVTIDLNRVGLSDEELARPNASGTKSYSKITRSQPQSETRSSFRNWLCANNPT